MELEKNLDREFQKIVNKLEGVVDLCESKEYILGFLIYRHLSEGFEAWWEEHKNKDLNDPEMFDGSDYEGKTHERVAKRIHGCFIKSEHLFSEMLKKAKQYENLHKELMKVFVSIEETNLDMSLIQRPLTSIRLNSDKLGANLNEKNRAIIEMMSAVSCLDFSSFMFEEMYRGMVCKYISLESEDLIPSEVSRLLVELTRVCERKVTTKNYSLFPIKSFFQRNALRERSCLGWISFKSDYPKENEDSDMFLEYSYIESFICIYGEEFLSNDEYKKTRINLIKLGSLDTIIRLPDKLFKDSIGFKYIVILKTQVPKYEHSKALFIDASEFFREEKGMNKLDENEIQKIIEYYKERKGVGNYAYSVSYDEIVEKNYDFSFFEYIYNKS